MGRRKLTEEEILQKQQEKEQKQKQLEEETLNYRKKLIEIIENLDSKTLKELLETSKSYEGLSEEEVINLLLKKFIVGDFKFKTITKYV